MQVDPLVDFPLFGTANPPPPRGCGTAPTRRHITSKRSGNEGRCKLVCETAPPPPPPPERGCHPGPQPKPADPPRPYQRGLPPKKQNPFRGPEGCQSFSCMRTAHSSSTKIGVFGLWRLLPFFFSSRTLSFLRFSFCRLLIFWILRFSLLPFVGIRGFFEGPASQQHKQSLIQNHACSINTKNLLNLSRTGQETIASV